jgi:hypothetical protein
VNTQQDVENREQGPSKEYTIYVNSRAVQVPARDSLTFDEVVALAFPDPAKGPNIVYTVTYRRGEGNKPQGTLVAGESVKVKDGMIFDVTRTDQS